MKNNLSAKTSIVQIPKIFKDNKKIWDKEEFIILNYGAGRKESRDMLDCYYEEALVLHYDPYHLSDDENDTALYNANKHADIVVCANVLNVILDNEELQDTIEKIFFLGIENVYFQIYKGNATGIPSKTQRNDHVRDYIHYIENVALWNGIDYSYEIKGNVIKIKLI